MKSEFAKLQAQVAALNAETAKMVGPGGVVNPKGFDAATKSIHDYSAAWRAAANSTGMFEAGQLRINSATDDYVKKLEKQKVTFRDMWRSRNGVAKAAYNEQLRMQQMFVRELPGVGPNGKKMYDYAIPDKVHKSWDTLGNRIGFAREQLKSASTQMVNWGKNTQWAGRQLMVGFTLPVVAFGAVTGKLAYDVDKQMTRIRKVYDFTADQNSTNMGMQAAAAQEAANLEAQSWTTASRAAKEYGASITETLEVQAELAAQGHRGSKLQEQTNQVMRIATLGEIDHAVATKAMISLTSIMGLTTKEAARQLDYMNSIENATSLSTEDFAQSIPIALGPLKEMGGNVQDLALMLVAMKERGIEASQAANSIKSMMNRLYRPSVQVREEWQKLANVDLAGMLEETGGDVMKIMPRISEAVKDLDRASRVKLLGGLFGTYQVGRQNAILKGLEDIQKGVGQSTRVLEVNRQGWKQWGETAEYELQQIQQSASGQFRIAMETLKAELAEMGVPFLEVGSKIIKGVAKLFTAFNELPDLWKRIAAGAVIFGAIVGPVVMLVGLFANFTGTMLKFGVSLTRVLTSFQLLDRAGAVAAVSSKLAQAGFITQSSAAVQTASAIEKLAMAHEAAVATSAAVGTTAGRTAAQLQAEAQAATRAHQALLGLSLTPQQMANQTFMSNRNAQLNTTGQAALSARSAAYESAKAQKIAAAAAADQAKESKKTNRAMQGAAAAGGIFAASMAASAISSNQTVDHYANIAMMSAIIGPAILAAGAAMVGFLKTAAASASAWVAWNGAALFIAKQELGVRGMIAAVMKASWAALINPMAIAVAAAAAIAASAYLMYKHTRKAADEVKSMTSDSDKIADIMGYTPTERPDIAKSKAEEEYNLVTKISDAYPELINRIEEAETAQDKLNEARRIGLMVLESGGSVEDAKKATLAALQAAEGIAEGKKIALHFKAQLDFDSDDIRRQAARATADLDLSAAFSSMGEKGFFELVDDFMLTPGGRGAQGIISNEAEQWLKDAGAKSREVFMAGLATGQGETQLLALVDTQLKEIDKRIKNASGGEQRGLLDLRAKYIKEIVEANGGTVSMMDEEWFKVADAVNVLNNTQVELSRNQKINYLLAKQNAGVLSEAGKKRLANLQREKTSSEITSRFMNTSATNAEAMGTYLGRSADAAYNVAGGANAAAGAINTAAVASGRLAREMEAFNNIGRAGWVDAYQGAMSSTQDELSSIASSNFDQKMSSSMDAYSASQNARMEGLQRQQEAASNALERRQEAAQNAFENRWERRTEAVTKSYDNRIKKIQETIKAEEKAEATRQRIFEAELIRVQRMNEMSNMNVDFTVALNTGELDEAAKISNDMLAKQAEYSLEDEKDRGKGRHEREIERLNERIEKIEEAKDARLKALKKEEEAERRSMQRRQERESRALDRRQQMHEAALSAEIANNIAAQQEIWDNRKEKMDKAIEMFRRFVPQNERELQAHIARVKAKYGDFNVDTRGKFNKTSVDIGDMLAENVRDAAETIRNDIRWAGMGGDVAKRFIRGAFGMSPAAFKDFMVTGKWPKGAEPASGQGDPERAGDQGAGGSGNVKNPIRHTGGLIDSSAGSRKGVARTNPLSPKEVMMTALKGEYVLDKDTVDKVGIKNLDALRMGAAVGRGTRGKPMGDNPMTMGLGGIMGASVRPMFQRLVDVGLSRGWKAAQQAKKKRERSALQMQGVGSLPAPSGAAYDIGSWDGEPVNNLTAAQLKVAGNLLGQRYHVIQGSYQPATSYSGTTHTKGGVVDVSPYSHSAVVAMQRAGFAAWYRGPGAPGLASQYGAHIHGVSLFDRTVDTNAGYQRSHYINMTGDGLGQAYYGPHAPLLENLKDYLPGLDVGGTLKYDGPVFAHQGETVLTEPLSRQLHEGIGNLAGGQGNMYNVNVNVHNPNASAEDIAQTVLRTLKWQENRKPRSR